jgi:hypothetical protein
MTFWYNDYTVLFDKDQLSFWPQPSMSQPEKLNAISRLIILITILLCVYTSSIRFVFIGIATLIAIVFHEKNITQESFFQSWDAADHTKPTEKNPLMNVLLPEINGNPTRPSAEKSYESEAQINDSVKSMFYDPILYEGVNNEMDLKMSMRNFYTTASTTVPNDQDGFAKFCYGNMPSEKDGTGK